jgi:dUTP pyrophosphatase
LSTGFFLERFKTVGFLKSKSGLNVKHGIVSEGVIDVGYTGSIVVKLYNHSDKDYYVEAGDKISQLVILPILTPSLDLVDTLDDTDRGDNGFGSSGR